MPNVKVVTAFVPIPVIHLSESDYMGYFERMHKAIGDRLVFMQGGLGDCWLKQVRPKILEVPPAAPVPADRYPSPEVNVMSHVIQHNRTTWARKCVELHPDTDVVIWLDLAIMKQGKHTGNPVLDVNVADFVDKVERYYAAGHDDIPFPGITPKNQFTLDKHGNNWRFCGSTHIWPVKYLKDIDMCYKTELLRFIYHEKCVPLDLVIWPLVEERSLLPFKWYQAEYDATQLTGFPNP